MNETDTVDNLMQLETQGGSLLCGYFFRALAAGRDGTTEHLVPA